MLTGNYPGTMFSNPGTEYSYVYNGRLGLYRGFSSGTGPTYAQSVRFRPVEFRVY